MYFQVDFGGKDDEPVLRGDDTDVTFHLHTAAGRFRNGTWTLRPVCPASAAGCVANGGAIILIRCQGHASRNSFPCATRAIYRCCLPRKRRPSAVAGIIRDRFDPLPHVSGKRQHPALTPQKNLRSQCRRFSR